MRYIFFAVFLAAAALSMAQAFPGGERGGGRHQESLEEVKKTASGLEEAVKLHPERANLHIQLGFAYARLERTDEAMGSFETAVRLDPKSAIAHYMLGLIYEKKGLREKAAAAWEACLKNAGENHMRETAIKHLHHLSIIR